MAARFEEIVKRQRRQLASLGWTIADVDTRSMASRGLVAGVVVAGLGIASIWRARGR
jgi:hypothetical protein